MRSVKIAPRFAGVYQVVALKKDGSRDTVKEQEIFDGLKACDGDVFHKVAENLHKEERDKQARGEAGAGTAYDPRRSFLFTKLANVITILTGTEAQGLSLLQPEVKVYPPKKDFPLQIHLVPDDHLVGRISSEDSSSVEKFLKESEIKQESLPQLDYNRFQPAEELKEERLRQQESHSTMVRRLSQQERKVRPIKIPKRNYSVTFVASPTSSPKKPEPSSEMHHSHSDSLLDYATSHAGWNSSQ